MSISAKEINAIRQSLQDVFKTVIFCKSNDYNTLWTVEESRKYGVSETIVD